MHPTAPLFLCLLVLANGLSLEKVSGKNVKKRTADFFPDWVPFKNKHGDELGEFIPVPKPKPKKRLAPPMNFKLKAVNEPDDDYAQGQGEGGEDYYEKKEWSDTNRPAEAVTVNSPVNHTEISEIDGVVDIITQSPPNAILSALSSSNGIKSTSRELDANQKLESTDEEETDDQSDAEEAQTTTTTEKAKDEDYADYDEKNAKNNKTEQTQEQKENDAKKAKILDSVDELKYRHAEEQRLINEKMKEEELFREEQERNNGLGQYSEPSINDKYSKRARYTAPKESEEDYEEDQLPVHDKYQTSLVQKSLAKPKKPTRGRPKYESEGKLSVFKNPQLYIVNDDDSEETITTTTVRSTRTRGKIRHKSGRYSSRYTTTTAPEVEENVRISLVPQEDLKAAEPALFFPKVKKNKRRRKKKTTTPAPDSYVAETIADKTAKDLTTAFDHATRTTGSGITGETGPSGTAPDSTGSGTTTSGQETAPSGSDAVSTNSNAVTDAVPASTDHKHEKKPENYHNEKGGGKEYHSEHSDEHEEHGKKAYEGVHKDTKSSKGHHDKEDHRGQYDDNGGHNKKHHTESGHYGDHHHEEHGKKHAKYEESGKHSKGHSTKGSHDIHKKEEYEKNVEFFEEEGDSAEDENHGGFHNEREHKKGGHFKKGDLKAGHHDHHKGELGHFQKGGHAHGHKDHRLAGGHDSHGKRGHAQFQKGGKEGGKKWMYHHGHPAKTANLVVIDRRADNYYHGPQYYG